MTPRASGTGVQNEQRIAALQEYELLDTPTEAAFDRLTRCVSRLLQVPVALVSLVDIDRQFFKSSVGVPEPWASQRETPLSHSFCQYVVETGEPFVVTDAPAHPLVCNNLAIRDLNVIAYLGIPLVTKDGMVLGSLCAIDGVPREWTKEDMQTVDDLAASVMTEIELRRDITVRQKAEAALSESNARLTATLQDRERLVGQIHETLRRTEALYHVAGTLSRTQEMPAILQAVVESAATVLPANRVVLIAIDMQAQLVRHQHEGGPGAIHVAKLSFEELWEGLSGVVLREGNAVLSLNGTADPRESLDVQQRRIRDRAGSILVAPIASQGAILGTLTSINAPDEPDFTADDMALLTTLANQAAIAIERSSLLTELQHQATIDGLTQLLNRRSWFEQAQRIVALAERTGRSVSVVLLDVDHFKRINDTYGHDAGDSVLQTISKTLRQTVRKSDLVGRYGGEELVILLPDTDASLAIHSAERIRQAVAALHVTAGQHSLAITVSLGIAAVQGQQMDLAGLVTQADQALYTAKRTGRNRAQLYEA